jgi:hypothetical protein
MDFGICVASKIDEVGYITHAENLGYSHAWVADSQCERAGLHQLMLLPSVATQYQVIEDFARLVMARL